jgi:predicted transcriptional regulator
MFVEFRADMAFSDRMVLAVLKEKLGAEKKPLTLQEIADAVPCHKMTAFNAIRRLEALGLIATERREAKPSIYEVIDR